MSMAHTLRKLILGVVVSLVSACAASAAIIEVRWSGHTTESAPQSFTASFVFDTSKPGTVHTHDPGNYDVWRGGTLWTGGPTPLVSVALAIGGIPQFVSSGFQDMLYQSGGGAYGLVATTAQWSGGRLLFQGFTNPARTDFLESYHALLYTTFGISNGSYQYGGASIYLTPTRLDITVNSISAGVPEPSTWAMMLVGFAGLGYAGYRKRKVTPIAA